MMRFSYSTGNPTLLHLKYTSYSSIQGRTPDYDNEAAAEVRSNGRIRMFIPITSRALCPINGRHGFQLGFQEIQLVGNPFIKLSFKIA